MIVFKINAVDFSIFISMYRFSFIVFTQLLC